MKEGNQRERGERFEYESEQDDQLVRLAKEGDRSAFGELVRRHRDEMFGYARSITKERFAAEDVVQDALLRAFTRLGSLADTSRFAPWIQRIVRNQAYNRISRGPSVKESSFSELADRSQAGREAADWGNLDYILGRVAARYNQPDQTGSDPAQQLVRREIFETMTTILLCLSKKERQVFESFLFEQLSPAEIGRMFRLSTANVYQILSRSRKKLAQEHIRVVVDQYIRSRKEMGVMKVKVLRKPEVLKSPATWTTAAAAICGLLEYTDKPLKLSMVMGLTGFAFRINIVRETVGIAGPTMFDFGPVISRSLEAVGYRASYVSDQSRPLTADANFQLMDEEEKTAEARLKRQLSDLMPRALDFVHHSVDSGDPVMVWDLFFPEFALIYGYDDENRQFIAGDCSTVYGNDTVPYDHLSRGTLGMLFVLSVQSSVRMDNRIMLRNTIETALRHYREQEHYAEQCMNGLAGYDVWIDALQGGRVEPISNSYNVFLISDARRYAAQFFEEVGGGALGGFIGSESVAEMARVAASLYSCMREPFDRLCSMFPFLVDISVRGGDPNEPAAAEDAVRLLRSIKELEHQAVQVLDSMYAIMQEAPTAYT
ncbi:RNA polymerase sigma factor [Paenibacillus mesophilus]|uniref:RNA polymerase sigma factor n=1 Tax=Paenibacillus mesophilus TaxID=2582849 RepID=UPI00110D853B|nr:RNA polymerase sigma factor [Paenibacillus mesophilus]TMV48729.1 RNA polymerase sigma factor [Paenibacillus mesophilus]